MWPARVGGGCCSGAPQALTGVVRGTFGSRLRRDATDAVPRRTSGPVRCMDNLVLGGCLAPPASAL